MCNYTQRVATQWLEQWKAEAPRNAQIISHGMPPSNNEMKLDCQSVRLLEGEAQETNESIWFMKDNYSNPSTNVIEIIFEKSR